MTTPTAPPNSSKPLPAFVVGGVYNINTEVLQDGQATPFQFDVNGRLLVDTSGGGGGGNVNITGINSSPPALSNPLPVELSDGTNAFGTAGNPLSVNVMSGGGSNASVGATGATAPTSATEIGIVDGAGKLQNVSAITPLPATGTLTNNNAAPAANNIGVLPAIANAAPPSFSEGDQVLLSEDLAGYQRTVDKSDVAVGTTAPSVIGVVGGKTNDGSPQYQPIPEGAGGRSVIVEGIVGGTVVPISGTVAVSGTVSTTDAADGTVGATAPTVATQVGGTNSLGQLNPIAISPLGNQLVQDGTPGDNTVLKEILVEMRAMRKLLFMLYEETGQGAPTGLVDDVDEPQNVDYTN
jgi:hypothetical protein